MNKSLLASTAALALATSADANVILQGSWNPPIVVPGQTSVYTITGNTQGITDRVASGSASLGQYAHFAFPVSANVPMTNDFFGNLEMLLDDVNFNGFNRIVDSNVNPAPLFPTGILAQYTFEAQTFGQYTLPLFDINFRTDLGMDLATQYTPSPLSIIPNPSTGALIGTGLGLVASRRRRR